MASAVHVEVAVITLFNDAVGFPDQETQIHQTLHQHPQSGGMDLFCRAAGAHDRNGRLLRRQHQAVEIALLGAEATVDREGAGDVAVVVVGDRTAGIDQ